MLLIRLAAKLLCKSRKAIVSNVRFWFWFQGDQGDPLVCGKKLLGHFIGGNVCNLLPDIELYSNIAAYKKWVIQTIKDHSVGDESDGVEDE